MTEKKSISMDELLNKMDDTTNTSYRKRINVFDSKNNKKYWQKVCNRLKRDMDDLEGWCETDRLSYIEYKMEHEEN